jgi:hypothetical protein
MLDADLAMLYGVGEKGRGCERELLLTSDF